MSARLYDIAQAMALRFAQVRQAWGYHTDAGASVHVGRDLFDSQLDAFPLIAVRVPQCTLQRATVQTQHYRAEAAFEFVGVIAEPQTDPANNPLALQADMQRAALTPAPGDSLPPLISDIELTGSEIIGAEDGAKDAQVVLRATIRWDEKI